MNYIVYLVLFLSMDPAPTFMIVDDYDTMNTCQEGRKQATKRFNLTPAQATRLSCMPLITDPLGDPI